MVDAATLAQETLNGLVLGAIIALASIGLTLVYGILRLANFAHGDFLTLTAYSAFFLLQVAAPGTAPAFVFALAAGLLAWAGADALRWRRLTRRESALVAGAGLAAASSGAWLAGRSGGAATAGDVVAAGVAAILVLALVSLAIDRFLWRPLRRKGGTSVSLLIASIGLALVIRYSIQIYFGGGLQVLDRPNRVDTSVAGFTISSDQATAIVVAIVGIALVHLFLTRTRTGRAMRAVADNQELARACGVDVERTIAHVWVLGGTLTGLAGLLLAFTIRRDTLYIDMGWDLLLPVFAAVILGGIGSAYGAMVGGFVVGVAMKTSGSWLGFEYDVAAAFVILVVLLLFRPQGFFGLRIR